MKKKRMVNGIVENQVTVALLENPDSSAPELKRNVEKELKKKGYNYRFTERTYLNIKKALLPNLGPEPIDQPWTVGACIKYDIPAQFIPLLLNEQKKGLEFKTKYFDTHDNTQADKFNILLTVREARWFVKLYPGIIELAKKQYPDDTQMQVNCVVVLARQYARRERVAKILGKDYPETKDIDKFLMQGDLSKEVLGDAIFDYIFPNDMKKKYIEEAEQWPGYTRQDYEKILGKLNNNQVKLLNEWVRSVNKGQVYNREWEKAHSKIIELVKSKGLDFNSLLATIMISQEKDGEQ